MNELLPMPIIDQNNKDVYCLIEKFLHTKDTVEQLKILKDILLDGQTNSWDEKVIKFLAVSFYTGPAKDPVKCFLSRYITTCQSIQEPFTAALSAHILKSIMPNRHGLEHHGEVVPSIMTCINFPAGAAAVKSLDMQIGKYLVCYSRERGVESTTKKNEIFSLEHSILRLLVHILQKLNLDQEQNKSDWSIIFSSIITKFVEKLILDKEVPMDTVILSGILLLSVKTLQGNNDAWLLVLNGASDDTFERVLKEKAGQLAVYSAIATTIPFEELQQPGLCGNDPPIVVLLLKLVSITEGNASEPLLTLGVARALVHVSRALPRAAPALGPRLVRLLLPAVWPNLEFYLDSVRHLALAILGNVLAYCAQLEKGDHNAPGQPEPLAALLAAVRALGPSRGRCWCAGRAAAALGAARVLRDLCSLDELLDAAAAPHLQAAATGALEALLAAQTEPEAGAVFAGWVRPVLARLRPGAPTAALEAVLAKTVQSHPEIVQLIEAELPARALLARLVCCRAAPQCRALLSRQLLRAAALDPHEETRILSLSLVALSARSTAELTSEDLAFVLWFLRYNINASSPNFRQLMLALLKKLLKRLEASYRAASVAGRGARYVVFAAALRRRCFSSALRGANHDRRGAALQLLAGVERLRLGTAWEWKEEYVETLLLHLDDSYESNKYFALEVLEHCPEELLEKSYSSSLELVAVLREAAALRPAAVVTAAYKLRLLLARLPRRVLHGNQSYTKEYDDFYKTGGTDTLRATYVLLRVLLQQVRAECERCRAQGVAAAARHGAMHGALHCTAAVLRTVPRGSVDWEAAPWSTLACALARACEDVNCSVEHVVAHAAPEGHVPEAPGAPGDSSLAASSSDISCADETQVTAQMVLVCAWRSVKEASAVLGLVLERQHVAATARGGDHLLRLLTVARHRGATEQAAAGLAEVAKSCWGCPRRSQLPARWLREAMELVAAGGAAAATRRGAGLPAAIQALVATELQATQRADSFNACMRTLLSHACADAPAPAPASALALPPSSERRTLAANILRALFRHAALERAAHAHAAAGLRAAVRGAAASAWPERTAMCLLFSALLVRVFGVWRAASGSCVPDARNTMSGRVFYQRYPELYDLMLSKLSAVGERGDSALRPAAYPVLLLLARLRPSAAEGCATSLKLGAFLPLVRRCARSPVLKTRQLAARAARALVAPHQFLPHIEKMFALVSERSIPRNYCHGVLLQLACLLEARPAPAPTLAPAPAPAAGCAAGTGWLLTQPCFVIAHEYVNVINLLVWRFPELVPAELTADIVRGLQHLLTTEGAPAPTPPARPTPPAPPVGRDVCLAACLSLYLVLLHKDSDLGRIAPLALATLQHASYEVVLATLNYLLILHGKLEIESCNFQQHLSSICDSRVLDELRKSDAYISTLNAGVHRGPYRECRVKCLRLLTLERDTQRYVIDDLDATDDVVIGRLLNCIETEHENLTHMYLESLLNFTSDNFENANFHPGCFVDIMDAVLVLSSAENSESTRLVVVSYLEKNIEQMMALDIDKLQSAGAECSIAEPNFRYKASILATLVTLLEDDDADIRQRAADVAARLSRRVILGNVTPGDDAVGDDVLDNVTPGDDAVGDDVLDNVTPGDDAVGDDVLDNVTPGDDAVGDDVLDNVTPGDEALGNVTSGDDELRHVMLEHDSLVPSACGELLRDYIESLEDSAALFVMLALLDFKSEVCMTDEINDEGRVFDQSERYNLFLEESVWTTVCADKVIKINDHGVDNLDFVLSIVNDTKYCNTLKTLCKDNLVLFEKMSKNGSVKRDNTINPKIEIFIQKLRVQ